MPPQNLPDNRSLKNFVKNLTSELFDFDKRILKTICALFFNPGKLSAVYFSDQKEKFLQPLKLYFAINFLFFFLAPLLSTPQFQIFNFNLQSIIGSNQVYQKIIDEEIRDAGVSREIYTERFNAHLKYNQPAFIFLVVPIFALILYLANFRKRQFYSESFIFASHFLSFFLLFLLIVISIYHILSLFFHSIISIILIFFLFVSLIVYLFISLRTFFKNKILPTIVKSIFLFIAFFFVIGLYVQFLFFYTILALKWGY